MHVALGLVLLVQPNRVLDSFDHLAFAYDDQDPKNWHTDVVAFNHYWGWYDEMCIRDRLRSWLTSNSKRVYITGEPCPGTG